jgi:hypothetical protein
VTAALSPVGFPPGYDSDQILSPLRHSVWRAQRWTPGDAQYRRAITAESPLHFWIGYLGPYFTDQVTGQMSFCEMHLAINRICATWRRPVGERHALVGWREGGKSTGFCFGGLLWALGHGYVRYPFLFSLNQDQIKGKLRRLLAVLKGHHPCSAALLRDFPELRLVRSSAGRYELAGGAILACQSLQGEAMGEVGDELRPDLLLIDDPLPKTGKIHDGWSEKVKTTITTAILPMGRRAHVVVAGTVMEIGDPMDDVVQLALGNTARGDGKGAWLDGHGFTPHYFPHDWPQQIRCCCGRTRWSWSRTCWARRRPPAISRPRGVGSTGWSGTSRSESW